MDSRNIIRDRAQALLSSASDQLAARAAWQHVASQIQEQASTQRPKPLVYEVHHTMAKAREAMLAAIVEGKPISEAASVAAASVGLVAA